MDWILSKHIIQHMGDLSTNVWECYVHVRAIVLCTYIRDQLETVSATCVHENGGDWRIHLCDTLEKPLICEMYVSRKTFAKVIKSITYNYARWVTGFDYFTFGYNDNNDISHEMSIRYLDNGAEIS